VVVVADHMEVVVAAEVAAALEVAAVITVMKAVTSLVSAPREAVEVVVDVEEVVVGATRSILVTVPEQATHGENNLYSAPESPTEMILE